MAPAAVNHMVVGGMADPAELVKNQPLAGAAVSLLHQVALA